MFPFDDVIMNEPMIYLVWCNTRLSNLREEKTQQLEEFQQRIMRKKLRNLQILRSLGGRL